MEIRLGSKTKPMEPLAQNSPVVNSGITSDFERFTVGLTRRNQLGAAAEVYRLGEDLARRGLVSEVEAEETSMQPGESYGEWLKRVIEKEGLNASAVQAKTGINRSSIFRIMTEERTPSADVMAALMVGLDLSDEAILQTTREVGRRTIANKKATNKNNS
jgi:predicted DNA-binding transcriptional regulator AlpA